MGNYINDKHTILMGPILSPAAYIAVLLINELKLSKDRRELLYTYAKELDSEIVTILSSKDL
jgi:hypothetical protein